MHLSAKCPQIKFKVLVVSVKKKKKLLSLMKKRKRGIGSKQWSLLQVTVLSGLDSRAEE